MLVQTNQHHLSFPIQFEYYQNKDSIYLRNDKHFAFIKPKALLDMKKKKNSITEDAVLNFVCRPTLVSKYFGRKIQAIKDDFDATKLYQKSKYFVKLTILQGSNFKQKLNF